MVHLELDTIEDAPRRVDVTTLHKAHVSRIRAMVIASAGASAGILAVVAALLLRL